MRGRKILCAKYQSGPGGNFAIQTYPKRIRASMFLGIQDVVNEGWTEVTDRSSGGWVPCPPLGM